MAPMIPLMAKVGSGVGFAITMSTTYHHPFYIARFFNALDHVTRGRIAWNAVTSAYKNEAANYGFDTMMEHDERYERAQEFLEVTCKLWDSVEKDALVADRENGIFADPAKVHRIDHRGRYFNVRGPLPALPSPQHRPVIIQAGLSGPGLDLSATYADMQFRHAARLRAWSNTATRWMPNLPRSGASRATSAFFGRSASRSPIRSGCQGKGAALSCVDQPEAGLVEMSAQYNVDFSKARPGMRLADFADEVREQKGNYGSFDELLKTTDPAQTVEEFGRRFLVDRILVAAGTPRPSSTARRVALRVRRQWRLYPRARFFGDGQHPGLRRARGSRTAAPWAVEEKICRPDAAR